MTKRPIHFLLSVIAVLFLTSPVAALAADAPPEMADMWLITPKEGHAADFRKALVKHMAFRSENGDPRRWEVYTPMLGNDLGRYGIRHCCFKWADQDSYREWQSGADQISEHFDEHVAPHVQHAEHYFESMDLGNSHWVEPDTHYAMFAVTEYYVKPGHGMEFDAAKEKMSQIALNHGWATNERSWIWASTIGGETQESIIIPHKDFASFEGSGESFLSFLSRHMGEAEATALLKQFASASSRTEFQIWEYRKELSMSEGD
ncbi:MAG: hypothetical protein KJO92_02500 [Gammaproteobacteria bacterium]|nr:hypothetical protein [Gammaproteobacteria bacterium]